MSNMTTGEYVVYNKGMPDKRLTIEKCLELQQFILDPSSRPYSNRADNANERLIARSAGKETQEESSSKSNIQKQLELQQMIIEGL